MYCTGRIGHKNITPLSLFPHCIGNFIPVNDPVRVLDAIVEHLDISAIEATYKGGGASSFAPRMLLKVILYAYLQNIHNGRKMEALLKRDVNFMIRLLLVYQLKRCVSTPVAFFAIKRVQVLAKMSKTGDTDYTCVPFIAILDTGVRPYYFSPINSDLSAKIYHKSLKNINLLGLLTLQPLHNPFHMSIHHSLLTNSTLQILKIRMIVHKETLRQHSRTPGLTKNIEPFLPIHISV